MIIAVLIVVGLCFGSFVNALVWRLHEQDLEKSKKKPNSKYLNKLSIRKGRSICPNCKHELAAIDLLPIFSWLILKGKCRHCHKPIPAQYPMVEIVMAVLFAASYLWWPKEFNGAQIAIFVLWLGLLIGLVALFVYDLRWMILPSSIIYPLAIVAIMQAIVNIASTPEMLRAIINMILGVLAGGGIFYVLYQISNGKWIGGGDIRLGWLLGLIAGTPARSLLFIFLAAILGSLISLPLLAAHRLKSTSVIPFGPFLIIAIIIVQLFGHSLLFWYQRSFLPFTV